MNTFKTQEELHRFLLDGGTIEYIESGDDNVILSYQDGQICYQDGRKASFHFSKPDEWKPYIKKEWYEEIPEGGVWCSREGYSAICLIKGYKDGYLFGEDGKPMHDLLNEIHPITKEFYEEIGKHIYEH